MIGASMALRDALDLEMTADSIRAFVDGAGIWAPLLFIALVTFRAAVLIPSQVLLVAAGFLFGAMLGTLYGAVGMTISGLINYALVRITGADTIRARFPGRFDAAVALAQSRMGAGAVVIGTGYPVGLITAVQLAAAVTGMPLLTFTIAVWLGALIRAGTFSFFGSSLLEGNSLLLGTGVLVAALLVPLLIPTSRAWLVATLGPSAARTVKPSGGVTP
jgi:uncharacterized membrane protein YdjX (TVP38/TMEM64 family)